MLFNNYLIFIYIIFIVVIYGLTRRLTTNSILRNAILFGGNVIIMLSLVNEHTLIVLSALSLLVYFIGRWIQNRNSKTLLTISLGIIIIAFSIRNYPFVQELISDTFLDFLKSPILSVQKIGLSYILFRYVHWLVESHKENTHKANFFTFINYILFFPTLLAGPIDTYNNFQYWLNNKRYQYQYKLLFAGITRIFLGAFKTLGIVPLIITFATDYHELLPYFSPFTALSISLLAYSAYIYIDFSGYSDIAIGTAYLLGIKTPENFNNPYISSNLSDFWKRWHITFSLFLKIYVFKPFLSFFNKLINPKHRLLVTILGYISTFVICGLWHGDQINFIYWGLWHGIGLAINKVWTSIFKPRLRFTKTQIYTAISILITFIYVTIGWMFFHYSHSELIEIFNLLS